MTGFSEDELVGNATRIHYPDDEEYIRVGQELYKQLEQKKVGMMEAQLQRKDGTLFDALFVSRCLILRI